MKAAKLAVLIIGVAMTMPAGTAFAETAAETNFRQKVEHINKTWWEQVSRYNKDIADAKSELDSLNKRNPHPADYDKQVAAIRDRIASKRSSIDYATGSANASLGQLQYTDTPQVLARLKTAVENGVSIKCVNGTVVPVSAASPPTTGAQIPDPTKTSLAALKFTVSNCQGK